MITARRAELLEPLATELGAISIPGDIASAEHRRALTEGVAARSGRLDILVNNAGVSDPRLLQDQTLDELETVLQVNLVAALDLCRLAAPLLFASGRGSVVKGRPDPSPGRPVGPATSARQRARPRVLPHRADRDAGRPRPRTGHTLVVDGGWTCT